MTDTVRGQREKCEGTRKLLTGQSRLAADRPPASAITPLTVRLPSSPSLTSHHSFTFVRPIHSTVNRILCTLNSILYFNVQTQIQEIAYRKKKLLIILSPIHCVFYQQRETPKQGLVYIF